MNDGLERFESHEREYFYRSSKIPLKTKLIFWGILLGGMVIGTFLFLFFLTVFIYVFLPLLLFFTLWTALRGWWKKR